MIKEGSTKIDSKVMVSQEGYTKIVNFLTPRAGIIVLGRGHVSDIVKIHFFYTNLLLYSQAQIRQTEDIVRMSKEGFAKIVNFMTPR